MIFSMVSVTIHIGRKMDCIQKRYPIRIRRTHAIFVKRIHLSVSVVNLHSGVSSPIERKLNQRKPFFLLFKRGILIIESPDDVRFDIYNSGFFEIFEIDSERFASSENIARYSFWSFWFNFPICRSACIRAGSGASSREDASSSTYGTKYRSEKYWNASTFTHAVSIRIIPVIIGMRYMSFIRSIIRRSKKKQNITNYFVSL